MERLAPDRARLPGRHALGQPAGHGGRLRRCSTLVDADDLAGLASRVARFAAELRAAVESRRALLRDADRRAAPGPLLVARALRRAASTSPRAAGARATNGLYARFFHAMLERGVALAPGAYEILFVSLAHDDDDLEPRR